MRSVPGPEEAGALLRRPARPGDRVLIKGGRGQELERVLAAFGLGPVGKN